MPTTPALVIIPTYNERESIERILPRVLATGVDILVVDDSSPDGTGEYVASVAESEPRIHLLTRAGKQGLGPAYLAGFAWGLEREYDVLFELDADGSHPPEVIPTMLRVLADDTAGRVGGVIGSRWVAGGSVVNWPASRKFISRGGSWYARTMLGLSVRDVTAGYRAYRADVLRSLPLAGIESHGYCFQIDMTRRIANEGFSLVEVPIEFRDREFGDSKMSGAIVREAMLKVTEWGFQRLVGRRP
ncbi:dolichol-phosphate mannosyltransferase [Microbacteriaceae bacterium SG_E_30_P1]|uniref:Dolichol-phosphate mannosyltransferase n=1 Tax=Antiquaquibacter oligotrophicus TaxID=2880260 RepID=A0ABT6KRE6_9MICO|nr:polyprenol monophosphomannose synthase [Antiquaquibacter oligotrophicus]MDH6182548.1 dolichol-phosphate mannosyltransferase [Antiquaquibacter oligotrophicus]UDF14485.1 polyprenol monophosphomannose synthase [Antiquaquibacter oligotrophicus]